MHLSKRFGASSGHSNTASSSTARNNNAHNNTASSSSNPGRYAARTGMGMMPAVCRSRW
jgi:hypothetical protein